jgi:hypothetical protein
MTDILRVRILEFRWVNAANGTDIFEAEEMLDRGLWDHPLLNHSGAASLFTPLGPWLTCAFVYYLQTGLVIYLTSELSIKQCYHLY